MAETPKAPRFWRSPSEQAKDPALQDKLKQEFATDAADAPSLIEEDGISRRRFLGLLGATAALTAAGGGCDRNIDRGDITSYTKRPENAIPGVSLYYATAYADGLHPQSLLVKTREARPILIEGNDRHAPTKGAASIRAQAQLLGLYDPDRMRLVTNAGEEVEWKKAKSALKRASKKATLLLTGPVLSSSQAKAIAAFQKKYKNVEHRAWEPTAPHGLFEATQQIFGQALLPEWHLDKAKVILSVEAELFGEDGNTVRQIRDFAAGRRVESSADAKHAKMSRLWVAESRMSLTGGKADERLPLRPSQVKDFCLALALDLSTRHHLALPAGTNLSGAKSLAAFSKAAGMDASKLKALSDDLHHAKAHALVAAGYSLPANAQAAVILLNQMLESEGHTLAYQTAAETALQTPAEMKQLANALAGGDYETLLLADTNPAFNAGGDWQAAIAGVKQSFYMGTLANETSIHATWQLPMHHWLESWGDFKGGLLQQPTMAPLFDTRQFEDLLLSTLVRRNKKPTSYETFLKKEWATLHGTTGSPLSFDAWWKANLHEGFAELGNETATTSPMSTMALSGLMAIASKSSGFDLLLHKDFILGDGRDGNIGWLQELPHPVTKGTWGNPLSMSVRDAEELAITDGSMVSLTAGSTKIDMPVRVQPGQKAGTLALALGYGHTEMAVAKGIGTNSFGLFNQQEGFLLNGVTIEKLATESSLHSTQEHHLMEGRDLIRKVPLLAYAAGQTGAPSHGGHDDSHGGGHDNDPHAHADHDKQLKTGQEHGKVPEKAIPLSMYPEVEYKGYKWGMAIDLGACNGCPNCVIACQAENNIPVVGPERVDEGREMHWIRIDRYYEGDIENPDIVAQPMLCQHCDNAPCENVCPVAATTHSEDGLNQMTYNRCVGTRYCANNCPYKARRFNYFDYTGGMAETLQLAQNPEVSIRARGIMEKCTFCVQRITEAKTTAKVEGRTVRDGEVTPACAAACPAEAIVFGDLNDINSKVAKMAASDRGYGVLSSLGVRPVITYLAEVTNPLSGGKHES